MKISQAISLRIKEVLKEKNITQYRLEKNACIPHSTMMDIVNARRESCNVKTLVLIIRTLGITVSDFFDNPIFESEELELD
mgnify:CR=1 FL=1